MDRQFRQLIITDRERKRLANRIWDDFLGARSNHEARINKFRHIYRMWRGLEETRGNRQDGPDFQVPMLKWITYGQWARIMQSILGDDAEIVARPAAPSAEKDAKKASAYMTWRFFEYMKATVALSTWVFRAAIFGRGHAEIPYEQEFYWERDIETGEDKEVLAYDGPRIRPLWPSQIILPAQDNIETDDDFEWVMRRDRVTPQDLLDGERRQRYQGIKENWREIMAAANQRQERDYWWDDEMVDKDEAEGVDHATTLGNRDSLEIWRWYGKWRLPKGKRDSVPDNLDYRDEQESQLMVSVLPNVGNLVVGVQDLRDLYPRMKKRHPFLSLGTCKDGSYWSPGLGELVEDLQNESSINHALFRKAGMLSVGPIIFFKPSSGFDPDTFEYRPGEAIPSEDPAGVKAITLSADLSYSETMSSLLKSIAELVTGVNDQSLGRASDRPNAPRTASGQAMLIEEGNTRVSLDMNMLRADLQQVLNYIWALDREYADDEVFFRVTDEDAGALFDADNGFGKMTAEEREHPYGFDLKFATSVWSREAKKQNLLQIYGLSMQNPLVATNPRALWVILNRIWEAFGEANFKDVIPEPPQPEVPKTPKDEWALMLKGEEVDVSPLDDDQSHIIDHRRRLQNAMEDEPDRRDLQMEAGVVQHIVAHEQQKRQKMLLQQLAGQAVAEMQAAGIMPQPGTALPQPGAPEQPPAQQPAGPVATPQQMTQLAGPPQPPVAPAGQRMPG